MPTAAVITVSDSSFQGTRADLSGPAVAALLAEQNFQVGCQLTVPDEQSAIEDALRACCERFSLVVTTGGTGVAPRDVTPEATRKVCDRLLDGFPELMRAEGRKETLNTYLSRALCGTRGSSLILNLPGSPRGAVSSLRAVLPLVPHVLAQLGGVTSSHPEPASQPEGTNRF
jgi:molybdenum cofactor synthesis domain-containing protein